MQSGIPPGLLPEPDQSMAWARERGTGTPRYILELDEAHRGSHCNCECISCGAALIAVNAARDTFHNRPHFRHPPGIERRDCLVQTARAAFRASLEGAGYLDLPGRGRAARVTGLSGSFHDAWVSTPVERVRVRSLDFRDEAMAVLTLDDGRELHVVLVGGFAAGVEGDPHAVIEVQVDDPALAGMSPDELRQRMRLLVSGGRWCAHWEDRALDDAAMVDARAKAVDALDLAEGVPGLPDDATPDEVRETLAHRLAKEILEREKRLVVPQMDMSERHPHPPRQTVTRKCRDSRMLVLTSVALEQRTGRLIPDVTATTEAAPGWPAETLLIEITVTHGFDAARRLRIRELGIPVLEIDLSTLGGTVSRDEFTRLIVDEVVAKRWIFHPAIEEERTRYHDELLAIANSPLVPPVVQRPAAPPAKYPENSRSARPSRPYSPPSKDGWLRGEALEKWKRDNPEAAAAWFHDKK
ncbi:hypothetical protein PWR05_35140 [Paraburkholderia sp. A2RI-6]|uniref:hypothetical protein n=1 Tax=Paraburkholderia sp. A2RI-6 TaxID=3028371 RepID=UPI003B792778